MWKSRRIIYFSDTSEFNKWRSWSSRTSNITNGALTVFQFLCAFEVSFVPKVAKKSVKSFRKTLQGQIHLTKNNRWPESAKSALNPSYLCNLSNPNSIQCYSPSVQTHFCFSELELVLFRTYAKHKMSKATTQRPTNRRMAHLAVPQSTSGHHGQGTRLGGSTLLVFSLWPFSASLAVFLSRGGLTL